MNFEDYRDKIADMMETDVESYDIFYQVDKMFHGRIELPEQLKDLDDVRLIKDSSPHDSLYNATVALANSRIDLTVTPLGNAEAEFAHANKMEQALKWNWEKANMRGIGRKMWDIAHSALRYDLCVTRVDDLMFWLPKDKSKWTKANKRAARAGRFLITVIPPHKIHFQSSPTSGASCVLSARNLTVEEVLDYYESIAGTNKEGQKIKSVVKRIKADMNEKDFKYTDLRFMLYQYTDDDKRLDYGHFTNDELEDLTGGSEDDYVFIDTENKIPFLNYTFRGGASEVETELQFKYHPMLASAHWHDLWINKILGQTLVYSDIIRRLRETREFYQGQGATDQTPPDDGTGGAKALPPGVQVVRPNPTMVDPQAIQVIQEMGQSLNQATSASALGNLSRYSNTAFSTMNAIVQVEMGKLNPQRNIIQDTISDQCYLFCEWTKFTKQPLQAWREEDKKIGSMMMPRGQEIQIGEGDYDLYRTFIKCIITPETPTDKMQQMNIVRGMVELGMSAQEGLEMLNVPHADLQLDKRSLELLKNGHVQALIGKISQMKAGEAQVYIQGLMMQLQGGMQPPTGQPQGQGSQSAQSPYDGLGGAGNDPNAGGGSPIQGAIGMGREQMNGTTRTGEDIAA